VAGAAATRPAAQPRARAPRRLPRPHAFTVVTAVAVVVAAAVFAFSRMDLGHTSGPSQPLSASTFEVTSVRTVEATGPQQVPNAPTVRRFPSTVGTIYVDVSYHNVTPQDALRIVILLQPAQGNQPAQTVSDRTHTHLDPGGEIAVAVDAPPDGFAPGLYTVRTPHDGHLDQTWTFEVSAAAAR
jgi:hypothetical protein